MTSDDQLLFEDALTGLQNGDFTRLDPLFQEHNGQDCKIEAWHKAGRFTGHGPELNEALACACFNGRVEVARYLMDHAVDPLAGTKSGMSSFHWAVNRGQLQITELLIQRKTGMETLNSYGGTVLGCAVWSAVHEPKPDHQAIIRMLVKAGADVNKYNDPAFKAVIDEALRTQR